jgi:hypothetical protein
LDSDVRQATRDVVLVLVVFVVAGALAGLAWHAWWAPAPEGFVYQEEPYFGPDEEFRSTGTFIAIAAPLGVVLGVVLTWLLDRDEVVTLTALFAGSALGAAAMILVGHLLGPESAGSAAQGVADFGSVKADLRVQPGAPWLVLPVSALVGAVVVLLAFVKDD